MGGETKDNLEAPQLLFNKLNGFAEDATSIHPDHLPLLVTHKAIMPTGWKLTKKGGACKVKTDFCLYCPCSSFNVHAPVLPCDDCKALQIDQYVGWVGDDMACYHYNIVDDIELKKMQERLTEIMNTINMDMAECPKSSTINLPDVSAFDQGGTNIQSITYAPPPTNRCLQIIMNYWIRD
jgi:hypothetical protein